MADFMKPVTKKQLRSFLGSMSYYRKFVEGFAKMSALLTLATSLCSPSWVNWTEEMTSAFKQMGESLCVVLCYLYLFGLICFVYIRMLPETEWGRVCMSSGELMNSRAPGCLL